MDTSMQLTNNQALDPLAYVELVGLANDRQGPVHVGVELRAHVFTLKRHGALR